MNFRAFTLNDQMAFAELSGDNNPLHIDAVAARRTMFGAQVVHGIHGVLRALDCVLDTTDHHLELTSIKSIFYKPIRIGDELRLAVTSEDEATFQILLLNENSTVTKILVKWTPGNHETGGGAQADFPSLEEPRALSDDDIACDSGSIELPLNMASASALFPNLVERLPPTQLASILHLSRLVGVRCPGLHSLFSEFELISSKSNDRTDLHYNVERFDQRVGLVTLNISAPELTGTVKAFRRPAHKEQPSYQELKRRVTEGEFANQRALIIGGSRGLGEVTAKLLTAGGADVKITYHQGKTDAQDIVADIAANGGIADCFQYDVLSPSFSESDVSATVWEPTHLYYFATPFIFSGVKGKFSPDLFRQFCDYYVVGFSQVVDLLGEHQVRKIFYPSSVAIDEIPKNMGEYSSAKAASELLCDFLEKCNPDLVIYKSRFPRTETDQTVSIIPVKSVGPTELMLKELRKFQTK